jgi:hypothetical protein
VINFRRQHAEFRRLFPEILKREVSRLGGTHTSGERRAAERAAELEAIRRAVAAADAPQQPERGGAWETR